jgi:hypothetical protein
MRKAKNADLKTLLQSLTGLELNGRYALERFGRAPALSVKATPGMLDILIHGDVPHGLYKNDNCRQYQLIGLVFDKKGVCVKSGLQ